MHETIFVYFAQFMVIILRDTVGRRRPWPFAAGAGSQIERNARRSQLARPRCRVTHT